MRVTKLPQDILDRVDRVADFHRATRLTYQSVHSRPPLTGSNLDFQPSAYRLFESCPKVPLPTRLLDANVPTVSLLNDGLAALPDSQLQPPQDLKTLATWLYMANGLTADLRSGRHKYRLRSCPSAGALFPCEIYVAAFAIGDLEPGFYHYSVREFALRKLREGSATLSHIKRGRPDLEFLKTVPGALLISTVFARSAWKYHQRGYRMAALDTGHLVENLVAAANGLGIQAMVRLRLNDNTMRELIGVRPDADFGVAEAVQTMVVWADGAVCPMPAAGPGVAPAPANRDPFSMTPAVAAMPPIERAPLSTRIIPYDSIPAAHQDCIAPGMPIREIRPPFTELSPVAVECAFADVPITTEVAGGLPLRQVLLTRRSSREFTRAGISRNQFLAINRVAFRGGSFQPLFPDGPYAALIRPFWVLHDVTGMDPGIWYYHPPTDKWICIERGDHRLDTQYLCQEQSLCGNAAAVCYAAANLHTLMRGAGPDTYRLAHLEAGIIGQRMGLAASSIRLGCAGIGSFYDEEIRTFLGLQQTGWEVLYAIALGVPANIVDPLPHPALDAF